MKNLIFFIFLILLLTNCSKNKEEISSLIVEDEIQLQMIKAYEEGMDAFNNRNFLEAAKKFN